MAKKGTGGIFSCFLYSIGKKIRFAPDSTFAPPRSEKQEKAKTSFLLSYRRQLKFQFAKMGEQSFFLNALKTFFRNLFSTRIQSFGLLFFTCGFLQILFYFLGNRIPFLLAKEDNLLFGVFQIFISLLCTFTRGDLEHSLKKSFVFRWAIRPLFGVDAWQMPGGRKHDSGFPMIFSGIILALLSVWFTPVKVLFFLLALCLISFVFYLPEAGLYMAGLLFFFLSSRSFSFLILITLVSFFCKCLVGKRSVPLTLSQWITLVFLGVLFVAGGEKNAVLLFQCIAMYFLISCLVRTTASLRRVLFCLSLGTLFCGAMLCLREIVFLPFLTPVFQKVDLSKILVIFATPETGAFLVLLFPLMLGLSRSLRWEGKIVLFPTLFLLMGGSLYFLKTPFLWNAVLLALILFCLFSYQSFLIVSVFLGTVFVTAIGFLPSGVKEMMAEFFGVSAEPLLGTPLFSAMHQQWGLLLWLCLAGVFGVLIYRIYRFWKETTKPMVYPMVLGVAISAVVFFYLGFCPVSLTRPFLLLVACLPAFCEVAFSGAVREEIRLPY